VNTPPCPTCTYPLRWFAPNNSWGCDRCQKLVPLDAVPAHVQDHPSQPYAPPGYIVPADPSAPRHVTDRPSEPNMPYSPFRPPSAPVAAPGAGKSKKGLVIGLAIAGVAVIGGIVAFVALHKSGPTRTRDSVIKETIAALAAGDESKLFDLADPVSVFKKVSRCDKLRETESGSGSDDLYEYRKKFEKEEADYRDPEKIEKRWRKDVKQLLRRTKGTKLEVVDILTDMPPKLGEKPAKSKRDRDDDDDVKKKDWDRGGRDSDSYRGESDEERPEYDKEYKLTTYKKGSSLMSGCYAKVPFRRQQVKVVVDIKEGERELTQRVRFYLQEIDGDWYLTFPPTLNVGFDVVLQDLQDFRDKTCKCADAGCVDDLQSDYGRLAYAQYEFDREDVPREMMLKMTKIQEERRVCEGTARGGPDLAKYKLLKDQVCACKDEECGRKLELQMMDLRRTIETNVRRQRDSSYEVTRQLSDLALSAGECTRKLALQKVRLYSMYPTSGDLAGGTFTTIRGSNFTLTPRTAKVFFGAKEATSVRFVTDSEMLVEVPPADVEGYVDVRVIFDPGGLATMPYGYSGWTYLKPLKKPVPKPVKPKPAVPPKPTKLDNPF
jgi:hypothetical protein